MQTPELVINGGIATITLRSPEVANRLSPGDLAELLNHINTVNATPDVRVLILRGQGKYFCSGYDLTRMGEAKSARFDEVCDAVEDARPITIAALHGSVYGGGTDLALACDFRIGVKELEMFMPASRLGLHFYQRGLERYVTRLGLNAAKKLMLTAQKIRAQEMREIGFITDLVDADQFEAAVTQLADTCAAMAPLAMLSMKQHMNLMVRGKLDPEALQRDVQIAAKSADFREGVAAWAEKRAPKFTGQ